VNAPGLLEAIAEAERAGKARHLAFHFHAGDMAAGLNAAIGNLRLSRKPRVGQEYD
jgi:hypothetical protein